MKCISSVSYSITINHESNGLFTSIEGIRQGDPLSPYIFIIVMEALNHLLCQEAIRHRSGIGVKICPRTTSISCLIFVDDCLLFCKTNSTSCIKLKNILDKLCTISGQLINFYKSILTFSSNASNEQKHTIMGILQMPYRDSLRKYIGCRVFQGRPSTSTFQDTISKATSKLEGWKANSLSKAWRTILIQLHLESLPTHTMQCFQLLKSSTNHLDKLSREFLWKKSNTEKGLPLISWNKVYMLKDKGGLGLRKTEVMC